MSFKPDLEAPRKDKRTNRAVKKSQFDPKGLIHKNYDVVVNEFFWPLATFYPTEIRNLGNGYGTQQSYHDTEDPEEIDMAVSSADPTMSRNPHPEVHISCRPFSSQASKQSGLMRVLHRWNLNRWHIRAPPGHYKVKSSIFLFCTNALHWTTSVREGQTSQTLSFEFFPWIYSLSFLAFTIISWNILLDFKKMLR